MSTETYAVDLLWVEKYRPKSFKDIVFDEDTRTQLEKLMEKPKSLPNLLFIGPAGTGKTSTARIICDNIIKDDMDLLVLNGSEQRGIDTVRYMIEFLSSQPMMSPIKIVFIDECDYLTRDAWASMRHVIEKYTNYARFIMTANESSIPKPIQSRFVTFKFDVLPKEKMLEICLNILKQENMQLDIRIVSKLINILYPDLRKIINTLQRYAQNPTENLLELLDYDSKVIRMTEEFIMNEYQGLDTFQLLRDITKIVTTTYLDYVSIMKTLFYKLPEDFIPVKILISQYVNRFQNAVVPSMLFLEFIYKIRSVIRDIP